MSIAGSTTGTELFQPISTNCSARVFSFIGGPWLELRSAFCPSKPECHWGGLEQLTEEYLKKVITIKGQVTQHWKEYTVPFFESSARLIRKDKIGDFELLMAGLRADLDIVLSAASASGACTEEITINYSYPSLAPDVSLKNYPGVYAAQMADRDDRYVQSVAIGVTEFVRKLMAPVEHLIERLTGSDEGQRKIFKDTAVTNLTSATKRYCNLNIGANKELDNIVNQIQRVMQDVTPDSLRTDIDQRMYVALVLQKILTRLEGLLVNKPAGNLPRKAR